MTIIYCHFPGCGEKLTDHSCSKSTQTPNANKGKTSGFLRVRKNSTRKFRENLRFSQGGAKSTVPKHRENPQCRVARELR